MKIKILGGGCGACKKLYENARKAVEALALSADVEYVTDMTAVMEYGVMRMPALVVDGKVVSMGKVLRPAEIGKLLQETGG